MASTLDCWTSIPVTQNPACANSTTSGSPTYPSPTTPTCAWCVSILRRSVSAWFVILCYCSFPVVRPTVRDDLGGTFQTQIDGFSASSMERPDASNNPTLPYAPDQTSPIPNVER